MKKVEYLLQQELLCLRRVCQWLVGIQNHLIRQLQRPMAMSIQLIQKHWTILSLEREYESGYFKRDRWPLHK